MTTPTDRTAARALSRALRMLAASDKSEHELRDRLSKAGFGPSAIDAAIASLRSRGDLNDDRVTAGVLRRAQVKGHSAEKIKATLRSRGLDDRGVHSQDLPAAIRAATETAAKFAPKLTPEARWRRVVMSLARLGHDEGTCVEAARAVLGAPPCGD